MEHARSSVSGMQCGPETDRSTQLAMPETGTTRRKNDHGSTVIEINNRGIFKSPQIRYRQPSFDAIRCTPIAFRSGTTVNSLGVKLALS